MTKNMSQKRGYLRRGELVRGPDVEDGGEGSISEGGAVPQALERLEDGFPDRLDSFALMKVQL